MIGPGPIGLLAVAVAKALGASPVILTGSRNRRLAIGRELGADRVVNINDENAVEVVRQVTGGIGADYVVECAGRRLSIRRPRLDTHATASRMRSRSWLPTGKRARSPARPSRAPVHTEQ